MPLAQRATGGRGHLAAYPADRSPQLRQSELDPGLPPLDGRKLDSGREYLSAAVALDPDYGTARKLWANTPWPLDSVVTGEQAALVPGWGRANW